MRVKRIELIGFKSFADRTEIHLDAGVTCVVGPNGCGKSNISDAIRWVFGERSAKLLRGIRMEDVIFSGTEFRKPLGMAEVSLILDNEDRRLPIEYNEVVFTRRLYRSGQSEYFLNRTPCRLKDILDLILDTGMGSNSYCMVEQGRVDYVIKADPEERRFLIEEAAGISKYKVKREEALRKLERTEQNLLRIRDIVNEVQKNIQYAEKQARRAERYKVHFEELKRLEIQKAFSDLSALDREKKTEEARRGETDQELRKLEAELAEILKKQGTHERLLKEILEEESCQAVRCFELRSESRSLSEKREFNRERLREAERRKIEIETEKQLLSANLNELEKEWQAKSLEREDGIEEQKSAQEGLQHEEEHFQFVDAGLKETKQEAERLKSLVFENASDLTRLRNELNRLGNLRDSSGRDENRRKETLEKMLQEKTSYGKKRDSHQEGLNAAGQELARIVSDLESLNRRLVALREEKETQERLSDEKKSRFQELASRLRLLEELEETSENLEKKFLASLSQERLQGKLVQSLREVLKIESGYESAVEAVLGTFAQGLIAEDVETAKGLMLEMVKSHMGPCGIFIRSLIKPNGKHLKRPGVSHPKVRHSIEEIVQVQEGLEDLFSPLFDNVYVVEDFSPEQLNELLPLAQEVKLVTKQGILLGPEARVFFRNGRLTKGEGSFRRQAEINDLKHVCEALSREIETAEQSKQEKENEARRLEERRDSFEDERRDLLIRKEATESFLRGLADRLTSMEEEIRILQFESSESHQEISQVGIRIQELSQQIHAHEEKESQISDQQTQIDRRLEELHNEREENIQVLARLQTLVENHEERLQVVAAGEALMRNQVENGKERRVRLNREGEELEQRTLEIREDEKKLAERQGRVEIEQEEVEAKLTEIRGRKAFQEEGLRQISVQAGHEEEKMKSLRQGLHEQELRSMDLSYRKRSIAERLTQTYGIKLSELRFEDFLRDERGEEAPLEERILSLKERVDSFGAVNLLAVEEYEELKQRFDFLANQEKDLHEARESLLEAIRCINRTTKTLFSETFTRAQALFQEHYQILFGGGHAELTLVEEEGTREAGVDIMVRPPGKKLQHISLLSGGEKALTAMALLFALFRIKPSPLCVLDEVDAPLDEANIDRFLAVLRTFLDSTQFLIVTHNRKTIATGDFLYGVTMEESGVSKIVSVKVARSEEKAAEKIAV